MSRKTEPRTLKCGEGLVTARRWQILAPRSWPARIMGYWDGLSGRMEWRAESMAAAWFDLLCGTPRGADRPYPGI